MKISSQDKTYLSSRITALSDERRPYWEMWRDLAAFYMPKRFTSLSNNQELNKNDYRNTHILDNTGTMALRTLANGLQNGVTSPATKWFKLGAKGYNMSNNYNAEVWFDQVRDIMLQIMAGSNFYNAMNILYTDLAFGQGAFLIYEDPDSVIRCYNSSIGEYYIGQDETLRVNTFARSFKMSVQQIVSKWGIKNCPQNIKSLYNESNGAGLNKKFHVWHMIEPNNDNRFSVAKKFKYREVYWLKGFPEDSILAKGGFTEMPAITPRWDTQGSDAYGTGCALDALPDVRHLQYLAKQKNKGLAKLIDPPLVADVQFEHRPSSFTPQGITYVQNASTAIVKPVYQIQVPFQELLMDAQATRLQVKETFFNDLFMMISQLETVRSATEIDARKEEKLVMLGSVLQRFENEALNPVIQRVFDIGSRKGLFPPAPEEIADLELSIEFISILSLAQKSKTIAPIERMIAMLGSLTATKPELIGVLDWETLPYFYADAIGVSPQVMTDPEKFIEYVESLKSKVSEQDAMNQTQQVIDGAEQLSNVDTGGGSNALMQMIG